PVSEAAMERGERGCPDDDAIAALIERRLSAEDRAGIERHLDACETCRSLAAALAGTYLVPDRTRAEPRRTARVADGADAEASGGAAAEEAGEEPARFIGRYEVVRPLGQGGMGIVVLAHDPELDRKVAVKILHRAAFEAGPRAEERLLREARSMARLT